MIVLAVNCGSSSLKFQLVDATRGGERRLARGLVERIGGGATATLELARGCVTHEAVPAPTHEAAVAHVLAWLRASGTPAVDAVGHRIVHGGARFTQPTRIDAPLLDALTAVADLAPLHNVPGVAGIRAVRGHLGEAVPAVAVFDTGFHATLPEVAWRYAIPTELADRDGIRRYGFHGISYAYLVSRYAELTHRAPESVDMIALHLGNGCSVAAIRGGRSVDTSMGFTPLEGLVMGTRSGDLDPAIVGVLAARHGVDAAEVERWLNERSGLLGLSGTSRDVRDLLAREADDPRARLALDVFCYRARKYVGAYLALVGPAPALVFTGGIGEHAAPVRARICAALAWLGLALDAGANEAAVGDARIGVAGMPIDAWVIATDEERMLARYARAALEDDRG